MRIGTSCQTMYAMPSLRQGLVTALQVNDPPRPRREPRQFHGKHEVVKPATQDGDALILEVRRLYEQALLPPRKIRALLLELGHDKTSSWVRATCNYHNRSHLIPTDGAASYLAGRPP